MSAPTLRFKEFESKVEVKKLGNISNIVVGFVGTVSDQYCDPNEGIPFVRTQNVREGYFSIENLEYVTKEFHKKNKKSQIFNGDVLIARVGANMGMVCAVENLNTEANCANVIIIKKNSQLNSQYLSLFLNSENGQKQIHSGGAGGAQAVFNTTLAKEISFPYFPLQEQTKIASFLSAVDEKINHLTQKHQLLSQYKQGMMQKLFSQKIRFKADDGSEYEEWDFIELGEALSYEQPTKYIVSSTEYLDTYPTPVLTAGKSFILGYTNEQTGIFDASNNNVIIFDDFTTAYKFVNFRFKVKSSAMKILKTNLAQNNIYYLYSTFSTLNFPIGDEHKRRWISEYSKQEIPLPCLAEQTKIANFLSAIDQKIEVVAQQIEQTKQWKKGLLQQMFV